MVKTIIRDYTKVLNGPPGYYEAREITLLSNGYLLCEILEGPYKGYVFVVPYPGPPTRFTVH